MTHLRENGPNKGNALADYKYISSGPVNQAINADHHTISSLPLPEKKKDFSADIKIDWQKEPLPEHATKDRKREWAEANTWDKFCRKSYEPKEAAYRYFDSYPDFARDKFYTTGSKRLHAAEAALAPSGWASKLLNQIGYPNMPVYFYSLTMRHLGLDPLLFADPRNMYFKYVVDQIKAAIADLIPRPYYFKIECGRRGGLHVHLVAARPGSQLQHLLFDGSEVIKPLWSGQEQGLFEYLSKPVATWSAENYATYLEVRAARPAHGKGRNVPQLSGQPGLKKPRGK